MEILKKNKTILIVAVVIVVLFVAYQMFASSSAGGSSLMSVNNSSMTETVDDRELLKLLTDMRNIHLDGRIFESQSYLSLVDFSRSIIPEPVGREDPFAPVPKTDVTITGGDENLSDQVLLR